MEFIRKIINRIICFIKKNNTKLLPEAEAKNEFVYFENDICEESSKIDTRNIDYLDKKQEFLETYQKFKDGKIKPEHILITDLIDFEVMMIQEQMILEEKVEKEKQVIKSQKMKILKQNEEIIALKKALNN